jgi:OmcA/MtrC family decaheme c-type cytochrome
MRPDLLRTMVGAVFSTAIALSIIGCKGSTGPAGQAGTNGSNGTNGTNGNNGSTLPFVLDAGAMTADDWENLNPVGTITSADFSGATPVVHFRITNRAGYGVKNLDTFTQQKGATAPVTLPNFYIYAGKLVPESSAPESLSRWVSYMVVKSTDNTTPQAPGSETNGTLKGDGAGNYTYTFATNIKNVAKALADAHTAGKDVSALGDVSVDVNAVNRVVIEFYGNARGYGSGRHANTADGSDGAGEAELKSPINMVYDFTPATGAVAASTREIVATQSCNACHTKCNYHGGHRVEVKTCVLCHTDQRRFGAEETTRNADNTAFTTSTQQINGTSELDFSQMVHKVHMGEGLQMTGYDFAVDANIPAKAQTGWAPNDIRYPQSVANCSTCHVDSSATPQASNWKIKPSRSACGGCHDGVDFVTGKGHGLTNLAQPDDTACVTCHNNTTAASGATIAAYHVPVAPPDPANAGVPTVGAGPRGYLGNTSNSHTNSSYVAGNQANLPAGAIPIQWDLQTVNVAAPAGAGKGSTITWTFRILNATTGQPMTINTFDAANSPELLTGFAGGPNLVLGYGATQDGIAAPNDYSGYVNVNLRKLWRGGFTAAGNGVTQDTNTGVITATYNQVVVPTSATLLTGGIGYFYGVVTQTQLYGDPGDGTAAHAPVAASDPKTLSDSIPLTQTNLAKYPFGALGSTSAPLPYQGGLAVAVPNKWIPVTGSTVTRRAIVSTEKCQSCHENLGVFTDAVFHAGQRNNAESCTFCHTANATNSGWGINIKDAVHALHASAMRTMPHTWQSGGQYWNVTYPAVLNNCEACHVPGSYDFGNAANMAQVPNLLWTTIGSGKMNASGVVLTDPTAYSSTAAYISPDVTAGANYGAAPTFNTKLTAQTNVAWPSVGTSQVTIASVPSGGSIEADPTTLVTSPITAACYSCHDSTTARAHMTNNGGHIAVPRSTVVSVSVGTGAPVASHIVQSESCLACHGSGKLADVKAVHMTN